MNAPSFCLLLIGSCVGYVSWSASRQDNPRDARLALVISGTFIVVGVLLALLL